MIVTIDGPAGAGKSSVARALAARLGFRFLDTGAMYRAVTWHCLDLGIDLHDEAAVAAAAAALDLNLDGEHVLINGRDVTVEIRANAVTHESRHVAANNAVRRQLVERQRELARGLDVVAEGRDQGTVAFPQAECKFFLTAGALERARRRQRELLARGESLSLDEIQAQQAGRDSRDAAREYGSLRPAADALLVDTTELTRDEVVARLEQVVRERRRQAASPA
jgi:cytidylate kinase